MLVLSRKLMESIVINGGTPEEITVTVVRMNHDKIHLGIDAPRHIPVHRSEVQRTIQSLERLSEGKADVEEIKPTPAPPVDIRDGRGIIRDLINKEGK